MYGTVARARAKAGQEQALISLFENSGSERMAEVKGAVAGYLFQADRDPNELIIVAIFEDKETYRANADDPEQDRWYRQMRELLEADPAWEDGEIVAAS